MIDTAERNALVEKNTRLVWKIALELYYLRPSIRRLGTIDDVVQVGYLGLIRAAELYDPNNPTRAKFGTYATPAIHNTICRWADEAGMIRIPNWAVTSMRKQNAEMALRSSAAQRRLRGQVKTLSAARQAWQVKCLADTFDRTEAIDDGPDEEQVRTSLDALEPRERWIVERYFGFVGDEKHTLQSLGDQLGVSRERVRQIMTKAFTKLRPLLESAA